MLFSNARRHFLSYLGMGAATSVVASGAALASTPTDDELRRQATARLMYSSTHGDQPFGLKSIGLDWKEEPKRLLATMRRWLKEELAKDALRPTQHKRFSGGISIPFATVPSSRYVRWEDEPVPELDGLMKDVERGDFTTFTRVIKELSEDYRYPFSERVAKLTKEQWAERVVTSRLCIDMNELTTAKLAYMIGYLAVGPHEVIWNKIEDSQRKNLGCTVKSVKDTEIQVYPTLDAFVLQVLSAVIWAGELDRVYVMPHLTVFNDYKAIR